MRSWKSHTLAAVLLLGIVVLTYAVSLRNGFIWDDNFQIVRNPYVHTDQSVTKILFTDVWGYIRGGQAGMSNYYRPLQMLTYRWTATVAGLRPSAFHLLSLLLNWLACIAAYGIFWQITKRFSLALSSAVLFAVHPMHSEAVLWIAALPELGCAMFYFLAFWLFLQAQEPAPPVRKPKPKDVQRQNARRRWLLAGSSLSFFLALLWKEMALTLPLVVAAYIFITAPARDDWRLRWRRGAMKSLPFWGVVAAYTALRIGVLGYFWSVQNAWTLTPLQYALNVVALIGEYCLRLLLPPKLNAYHVFHAVVSFGDARWLGAALFLSVAIVAIVYAIRRAPRAAFAGAWILLTLVPVLNLGAVGTNVFAERYLYIPSLGFALLLAWGGAEVLKNLPTAARRNAAIALVLLITAGATAQIWHRIPNWHDERAFLTSTVAVSPDAAQMRNSLGQVLRDSGDLGGAQIQYEQALAAALAQHTNAHVANAYLGLAFIAWRRQQFDRSLELIDRGLTYADLESLHASKGIVLLQMGRVAEAKQVLEQVYRYFPYDEVTLNALGVIALAEQDRNSAIRYFNEAVHVMPTFADGYNNLGRAYSEMGNPGEASQAFQRATELQPNNPLFRTNYGVALAQQGHFQEARAQLQQVLQLDPSNGYAASVLNRLNQMESAH